MNKRTLHLVLKRKWWDMIERGEKPEEYRDVTALYCCRLLETNNGNEWVKTAKSDFDDFLTVTEDEYGEFACHVWYNIKRGDLRFRDYDEVCFHRGYTNVTMIFEFKGSSLGYGNPDWGAPTDREVFKIKLGKRI